MLHLLLTRRFAPLFWSQFFSAFNDNFVRQMLGILILFRLGAGQAGALVTLAVAIFILPSIILSGLGGEIADSHDKALIVRRLKFAEIFVQMIAAAGFWFQSMPLLYAALLGLGTIAALFGPIKYGILPDHLAHNELPSGNALVEAATFLAILLGLTVGGYAAAQGREPISVVVQLMVIALACWGTSRFIPPTAIAAPDLKITPNVLASSFRLLQELGSQPRIATGALCVSWFWMVGAVALSLIPVAIKQRIGGDIGVETAVSALFAVGIAVGSISAAVASHGRIDLRAMPFSAVLMGLSLLDLGRIMLELPPTTSETPLATFLASANGLHIGLDVLLLSGAGGVFVVPVFAAVQAWAEPVRRARVIGGANVMTALFMVGGSLASAGLLSLAGLSEPMVMIGLGLLNLGFGAWVYRFSRQRDA